MTMTFNELGGVSIQRTKSTHDRTFITIAASGNNNKTVSLLDMWAPVDSVYIEDKIDISITKSILSDILVGTFGDTPVTIRIEGASFIAANDTSHKAQNNIMSWYSSNKFDGTSNKVLTVALSWKGIEAVTYKCILTGINIDGRSSDVASGICKYDLRFVGVNAKAPNTSMV